MSALPSSLSAQSSSYQEGNSGNVIAAQWPTLSRALSRYDQNTAESFSGMAYDKVEAGLIRLDDRRRLADAADAMGIREFDAQLLIACAIRRWALDRRYDPSPSKRAPALSFEYRSWTRVWTRIALVLGTAAALDTIILIKWLS